MFKLFFFPSVVFPFSLKKKYTICLIDDLKLEVVLYFLLTKRSKLYRECYRINLHDCKLKEDIKTGIKVGLQLKENHSLFAFLKEHLEGSWCFQMSKFPPEHFSEGEIKQT